MKVDKTVKGGAAVRTWLVLVAVMIFCMVIVGGATRLTDSGLSITEWQPLLGAIPPLSEADWLAAFEKYKLIPEYQIQNKGMSLEDFKFIYWWEWAHRFLGRVIGVVFIGPLVYFFLTNKIDRRLLPRLAALFVLGGLQGVLGWYMVSSGLAERVDVSQYRLAAHLTLAFVLYGAVIWTALGIGRTRVFPASEGAWFAVVFLAMLMLQVAAGGFVAGLDAGMVSSTWPKMDGEWIPAGLLAIDPWWWNLFENAMTVQFIHRVLAYMILVLAAVQAMRVRGASALVVLVAVIAQAELGILTVLWKVPLPVALLHQAGAMVVVALAIWHLDKILDRDRVSRAPVPSRQ